MKKIIGIGTLVLILAGWAAATVFLGARAEDRLRDAVDRLAAKPRIQVSLTAYDRGFLGARGNLRLALSGRDNGTILVDLPVKVRHGPFLAGSGQGLLGAAAFRTARSGESSIPIRGLPVDIVRLGGRVDVAGAVRASASFAGGAVDADAIDGLERLEVGPLAIEVHWKGDEGRFAATLQNIAMAANAATTRIDRLHVESKGNAASYLLAFLPDGALPGTPHGRTTVRLEGIQQSNRNTRTQSRISHLTAQFSMNGLLRGQTNLTIDRLVSRTDGGEFTTNGMAISSRIQPAADGETVRLDQTVKIDGFENDGASPLGQVSGLVLPMRLSGIPTDAIARYRRLALHPFRAGQERKQGDPAERLTRLGLQVLNAGLSFRMQDGKILFAGDPLDLSMQATLPAGSYDWQAPAPLLDALMAQGEIATSRKTAETLVQRGLEARGTLSSSASDAQVAGAIGRFLSGLVQQGVIAMEDDKVVSRAVLDEGVIELNGRPVRDLTPQHGKVRR